MVLPFSEDTQASQVTQCSWRELACIQDRNHVAITLCAHLSTIVLPALPLPQATRLRGGVSLKLLLLSPSLLYVKVTHVIM